MKNQYYAKLFPFVALICIWLALAGLAVVVIFGRWPTSKMEPNPIPVVIVGVLWLVTMLYAAWKEA